MNIAVPLAAMAVTTFALMLGAVFYMGILV
jgi:hypothetical protein